MDNYIVSARKYRPVSFETVVGQEHVTRTLLNEVKNHHLAQAFLFNGPRGVGKTTCARILAKEINKESVSDKNYDYSYNIFELDAASNNSVDDIRLLNEQVRIPPQVGAYKVYIIDEVHMLSASAFNAFLKTLEEPPPYAIFILATTERHKILPTILSRCQVFNFNRISVSDMVKHLQLIAEKEKIKVEEEALHIIAQKADGALRDALSIFDQMASIGESSITYAEVIENLSVLDYDYYFELSDAFRAQDVAGVLQIFDTILQKGFDAQIFLNGLSSHFRDLMVVKDERTLSLLDVPSHIAPKYLEQSNSISQGFLVNAINIANKYDQSYKISRNQRLHVELALIKICYLTALAVSDEKKKIEYPSKKDVEHTKRTVPKPESIKTDVPDNKEALSLDQQEVGQVEDSIGKDESERISTSKPIGIGPSVKVAKLGKLDDMLSKPVETNIGAEEPSEVFEEKEVKKSSKKDESFDLEKVETVLANFAKELAKKDQTRLQSIFKFISTEVEADIVRIHLNKQHRIQIEDIKVDLLVYLRKELSNNALQLQWVDVKKKTEGSKPYTSLEKFDAMVKKNPNLKLLKDTLNLKIE
jgi:DNA polymerase III subunit gamma/tau